MSKDAIIIVLGILVAAMPFLGFPSMWERIFLMVVGITIAILAFLLRGDVLHRGAQQKETVSDAYVENGMGVGTEVKPTRKKKDNTHAKETT